jgi:hypothetical protein
LPEAFRQVLGPKTIRQCRRYFDELKEPTVIGYTKRNFLGLSNLLRNFVMVLNNRDPTKPPEEDAETESVLVDSQVWVDAFNLPEKESRFDEALRPDRRGIDSFGIFITVLQCHDLLHFYICRLMISALKAVSIRQGLCSPEGMSASFSILSLLRRGKNYVSSIIDSPQHFDYGMLKS